MAPDANTPVHRLAHAALRCLRGADAPAGTFPLPSGAKAEIAWRGPRQLPDRLPDALAEYETVRLQPAGWSGAHRLVVRVPLVVLDLAWNADEPVRIMTFCRGDWERDLLEGTA